MGGTRVALLASQGLRPLPPAMPPARANAWALAKLGVKAVIVITAAGELRYEYAPGAFVVSDQILDRTSGRPNTFYDRGRLIQLSAPDPFDPELRRLAISALTSEGVRFQPTGTVVVTQGPRFSTRAESRFHSALGADAVNTLLMPFVPLAQELGLGVCNISFITDHDADDDVAPGEQVSAALIERRMAQSAPIIRRVISSILGGLTNDFEPTSFVPADDIAEVLKRRGARTDRGRRSTRERAAWMAGEGG